MDSKINPPTIGKRPPTSIIYGLLIAVVLFLLLPLTQLIDTSSDEKEDIAVVLIDDDQPPELTEIEPPEVDDEEIEIKELEEPPPLPDLSMLELATNVNISDSFSAGTAFDFTQNAKQAAIDTIFDLSQVSKRPTPTYRREPVYPPELKRLKIQGSVTIDCVVDQNGNIRNPKIHSSDNVGFNKNALDAVRKWKFTPGEKDGKKVMVKVRIPINFNLK